jgi:hypothetical protein
MSRDHAEEFNHGLFSHYRAKGDISQKHKKHKTWKRLFYEHCAPPMAIFSSVFIRDIIG